MKSSTPGDAVRLSPNAITVLEKRYLLKDETGAPVESPRDLFWRVARTVAEADQRYGADEAKVTEVAQNFFGLMAERQFVPNSPTLMNAGRPLGQLSACFVLPVDDALSNGKSGIYDTLRAMALVHQSGGGTGFSFSRLRPKNDIVRSTMGVASGPVSFMSLFDASTDVVKQGGTRRGANMGILRVDHPDILEFIRCKDDTTKITNFNISVAVTDAFMAAVEANGMYDLIHPKTGQITGQLRAREVWEMIIHGAWKTGEPGVFFVDKANYYNPVPHLGSYEATNPCGEQPLLPYDVCNLGSINLGAFVREGGKSLPRAERGGGSREAEIDWDRLRQVVHLSTHFLENVIDANQYPLSEITDLAQRIRRIGLGVMGLADVFVKLGVPYDSDEGVALGRRIQQFVDEEAKVESERLANERGVFPEWAQSIWGPDETAARNAAGERIRPMRRLRNCNVTTVAPTGTISIIAGCSSGIEPLFAVAFMRNQAGALMPDVNEDFVAIAKAEGWYSDDLVRRIAEAGHINFPEVPPKWQRVFVTANAIKPEWHIRMQAAFQEFNDSAISKTCNFAHDATEEYVEEIYRLAYRLNCKGVTVYRDGSREMQVLSTGSTAKKVQEGHGGVKAVKPATEEIGSAAAADLHGEIAELRAENDRLQRIVHGLEAENLQRRQKRSRPEVLRGTTRRVETPLGTLYVTITEDDRGQPFEVFMTLGKAGGALMADVESLGRLISLALRSGIPIKEIYRQLRGISSDRVIGLGPNKILSVPDAVGIAIERWMQEKQGIQQELLPKAGQPEVAPVVSQPVSQGTGRGEQMIFGGMQQMLSGACPDCGSQLEFAEGCMKCHVCGFSECG
jgi:ribonucleoside-diphosphate reductase alpha chain